VRDVARKEGKQASLELVGSETEVDKRVLELIKDPLMHVIRNAVSHGIETPDERERAGKSPMGTVVVRTQQTGGLIQVSISDDGRGGVSEAPRSIRARAADVGGCVELCSPKDGGTTIAVTVPLRSMAVAAS
jgi:two-component system chemotaxis sensor kinase CheA